MPIPYLPGSPAVDDEPCVRIAGRPILRPVATGPSTAGSPPSSASPPPQRVDVRVGSSAETLSRMTTRTPDVASSLPQPGRSVSRLCAGREGHAIICRGAGESRYNQRSPDQVSSRLFVVAILHPSRRSPRPASALLLSAKTTPATWRRRFYADLAGFAPLLIQVGVAETLVDHSSRLAKATGAEDVSVELQIWPEMVHVWYLFHPELQAGKRGIAAGGAFVRAHCAG